MDAKHEDTFTLRDWNDEDRMNFMFSAFPKDRNINPRHWDSKMNYWIEEIKRCCLFYGDVCINCEKLRERFSRKDRVPHGLNIVISQMEKQGLLTNEETLLQNLGNHWLGWTYAIIKESTKWALSNLWGSGTTSDNKDFVFCETLDVLGSEILTKHHQVAKFDKTDHVVPWKVVKEFYLRTKQDLSDNELMLIVAHLKSKRMVDIATNTQGEKLLKFARNKDTPVQGINENDWHILRLKKALAKLKIQTVEDKKELSRIKGDTVGCLKQKDKAQAKRLMYQKRKLEKSLNQKQDTLLTLTDQLTTIQNADSNRMILDAISSSSAILNASLQDENLSPEKVDEIFEKSIETADYAKEIDSSILQGLTQLEGEAVDLQELEDELSELLLENEIERKPTAEEVLDLPKVPSFSPGAATKKKDIKMRALAK